VLALAVSCRNGSHDSPLLASFTGKRLLRAEGDTSRDLGGRFVYSQEERFLVPSATWTLPAKEKDFLAVYRHSVCCLAANQHLIYR
jgi:hypothetical protein